MLEDVDGLLPVLKQKGQHQLCIWPPLARIDTPNATAMSLALLVFPDYFCNITTMYINPRIRIFPVLSKPLYTPCAAE
jgi:hypothetical protein